MKSELVVKDNALINASYTLGLVEQRLILLAIVVIREHTHNMQLDYIAFNKPITITAESYINAFGVAPSTAYETLKDACKSLFSRQFSYHEPREKGKVAYKTTRWVSDIAYIDNSATVEFTFAPAVLPLIVHLEKHLTSYELKQVANLTSGYAIRLYELLISWRSVGKTPEMDLFEFRQKMGILESEYPRIDNLKRVVLEPAIKQINKYTDISVTYEQHKTGRSITGFSFKFKQKQKTQTIEYKDQNTPDLFFNMTEAQLNMFSLKLADLPEIGSKIANVGEDPKAFVARLRTMLMDEKQQRKLHPYLKQLGFEMK